MLLFMIPTIEASEGMLRHSLPTVYVVPWPVIRVDLDGSKSVPVSQAILNDVNL